MNDNIVRKLHKYIEWRSIFYKTPFYICGRTCCSTQCDKACLNNEIAMMENVN